MNIFCICFALQVWHVVHDKAFEDELCCDIVEGTEEIKCQYYIREIIYIWCKLLKNSFHVMNLCSSGIGCEKWSCA